MQMQRWPASFVLLTSLACPCLSRFTMAFKGKLLMQGEALRVLREHLDAMTSYFPTGQQNERQKKRLAVLETLEDLQKTHAIRLSPQDALWLWNVKLQPLENPKHPLHRKHFFDLSRHLPKSHRSARARDLRSKDEDWIRNVDKAKVAQIRDCIKADSFPADVSLQDVIQVVSRDNVSEIFS